LGFWPWLLWSFYGCPSYPVFRGVFLAKAVGRYNALEPVAEGIFNVFNLSKLDPVIFLVIIVSVSMFLHLIFTSTTVYATVMVPLVISLASFQTVSVNAVALSVAFLAPVAVILPVNTIPNIVFHDSGYFNQRQIIAYGLLLSIISVIVVLTFGLEYWRLIGLI
jgi:di/tricarboxylate transporter